jgi:hypothetical protein
MKSETHTVKSSEMMEILEGFSRQVETWSRVGGDLWRAAEFLVAQRGIES